MDIPSSSTSTWISSVHHSTLQEVYSVWSIAPICFTCYKNTSWRCSYSVFPKEGLTPVNFVTETSPRPRAVRGKKKRQSVSRLCCTNKSEYQWISQSVSPYHQSTTRTVRRPSALPVATLAVVCGSAGWVSPSGTLWLHPYKSKSSTGLPSFHLSHYRVGVWRNSH